MTRVGGKGSGHEVARLCPSSTWGHSLTPGLPSCTRSQFQDIKFTCKMWGDLNVPMFEPPSSRLPCVPHSHPNMYPWKRLSTYCLQSMWVPPCNRDRGDTPSKSHSGPLGRDLSDGQAWLEQQSRPEGLMDLVPSPGPPASSPLPQTAAGHVHAPLLTHTCTHPLKYTRTHVLVHIYSHTHTHVHAPSQASLGPLPA